MCDIDEILDAYGPIGPDRWVVIDQHGSIYTPMGGFATEIDAHTWMLRAFDVRDDDDEFPDVVQFGTTQYWEGE